MNFSCSPRRKWSRRSFILFSFPAILLLIYVLHWSLWDISAPLLGTYIVHDKTLSSLNNSSQQGVIDMNSQKMNNPNRSGQKGVADVTSTIHRSRPITLGPPKPVDGNIEKSKSLNKSRGTKVANIKRQKNRSNSPKIRIPPETTDGYSQKMSRLKTLLQRRVAEDDPTLIQLIRTDFIFLPETKPYNLKNPDVHDYSCGQSSAIDNVLHQREKGFYIEAGAFDGESISNTLFFEKVRKWNGLLIEPDPFVFERLKAKNRKAILVNSCLNIKPQPSILEFNRGNEMGRVWVDKEDKNWVKEMKMQVNVIEVPCFSLYSILLAVNQTTIDYFSLDVEGRELSVLQSIPFDKLHIDTFTIEYLNGNDNNYYKDIKSFMEKNGYQHVQDLPGFSTCVARDSLFKKK
ncbi:hypothetical protein ACJMK2_025843 [Sinanodonta woodiana]|uniref:Methyltransferase FkbM domain-containing protein n=1 Tax=Sinanodonta woodiana TaxID=1069815 RepID=A0ABD3XJL9_SINWO